MRLRSFLVKLSYCRYIHFKRDALSGVQSIKSPCLRHHSTSGTTAAGGNQNTIAPRGNYRRLVLGIETSCDDTGAAVVDDRGNVVGDALNSQTKIHVELGGIIPPIARDLHRENMDSVVTQALQRADVALKDLDAVAVTVKPGLPLSLLVGLDHAKLLVHEAGLPLIPVHHMEAHALTARMMTRIDFPFLVLLASGGHCLLAVARDVSDFLLLGTGLDEAPGDTLDKIARQLKLKNLPECRGLSGGAAVELVAKGGNSQAFPFPPAMSKLPNCHFSFSGLREAARKLIVAEEKKHATSASGVVVSAPDICASFQLSILRHLARRLQRALLFCELKGLLPEEKTLVLSGGVGSNASLRSGLRQVCESFNCQLVCPPPHLCTDNGIMIAWNGMEKLLAGTGKAEDVEAVDIQARCPLGKDISEEVAMASIKLPRLKLC